MKRKPIDARQYSPGSRFRDEPQHTSLISLLASTVRLARAVKSAGLMFTDTAA